MKSGGIGVIQEGKLKGRKFIIPAEVWAETGKFMNGSPKFAKACLVCEKFIPDGPCKKCLTDEITKQRENMDIGLT